MSWIQVGYFPKQRVRRGEPISPVAGVAEIGFWCAPPVDEICSVSDCIATGPEGWREQQKHNVYDLYDSPELAWSIVPPDARPRFELFTYRLLLTEFLGGRAGPLEPFCDLSISPIPQSWVRLGWDAVVGGNQVGFGCSPMSCNAGCDMVEIAKKNRYCLVSTLDEAIELARHFSRCEPEPGPYCVVEVWREAGQA